jgi:ABC-type Mn2+/Zn2+ transport system permease subunit
VKRLADLDVLVMPQARDEYLFVVLLTVAIVVSVKVMGALMVEAMLVVPAASVG